MEKEDLEEPALKEEAISSDFGRIPCLTKSDLIKWACKFIEVREEG